MKKILTTILMVASILYTTQAQEIDRSNHTLLWEITGNDFQKPSYLFGSMHVEDERVFEFSDSMLVCFENCEGFSGELNMDSMMHFIMSTMFSGDTTNVLKDLLSPEAYEGLNNKLMSKSGHSIEDLDNKQPWIIEMLMDDDPEERETDFDAFLDLFLYNYAKKRSKKTYGLEKIEDQLNLTLLKYQTYEEYLVDSLYQEVGTADNAGKELEKLKKIYLSGDINVIDEIFIKPMPDDIYKQKLLTDRNIVMAENIERLGNEMPMFNVVGAAHLPGNMGVIDLLRKKGFKVRAVTAEFTGKNQLMDVSDVVLPWETLDLKEELECTLEFPIKAVQLKEFEDTDLSELDFYASMDIGTQEIFSFLGMEIPRKLPEDKGGELLSASLSKMFEDNDGLDVDVMNDPVDVEYEGFKGKELKGTTEQGGAFIGRAFIQNKKIYYLYIIRENGELKNADRFFNGFHIFPTLQGQVEGKVVLEDYALSFVAPVPLNHIVTKTPQDVEGTEEMFEVHQYRGSNEDGTISYIFQMYDLVKGTYLEDVNAVIEETESRFREKGVGEIKVDEPEIINQVYYQKMSFKYKEVFFEIDFCFRGSRVILSMILGDNEKETKKKSKEFLSSVELLDFKIKEFEKNKLEEFGLEISLPNQVKLKEDKDVSYPNIRNHQLTSTDKLTNAPFVFDIMEMSEYYEIEHPDTFLMELVKNMKDEDAEIIYTEFKNYQGYPSCNMGLKRATSNVVIEIRACLVGNWIYSISTYVPQELSRTDYVKKCFNSLKINPDFKRVDLTKSKSEKILKNLTSSDIEIFKEVKEALEYHEFSNDDLPLIYEVLDNEIPMDTTSQNYYSVRELLLDELLINNDEKTIPFLKKLFIKSETEEQVRIVGIIGELENNPYTAYWELIPQIDFSKDDYNTYQTVDHFYGESELVVDNISKLMELSKNEYLTSDIFSLFLPLFRQDSVDWKPALEPYQKGMFDDLKTEFNRWIKEGKKEEYNRLGILLQLLRVSKNFSDKKDLIAFVQENINLTESYLLANMATILTSNNISLEEKIWNKLEKEFFLYSVIDELSDENYNYSDVKVIPKKYKNQKTAARLGMIMSFEYDYSVGEIEFIQLDKISENDKSYNRYVYRIKRKGNEDDNIIGLVICPSNKKRYSLSPLFYDYAAFDENEETLEECVEGLMKYFEGEE